MCYFLTTEFNSHHNSKSLGQDPICEKSMTVGLVFSPDFFTVTKVPLIDTGSCFIPMTAQSEKSNFYIVLEVVPFFNLNKKLTTKNLLILLNFIQNFIFDILNILMKIFYSLILFNECYSHYIIHYRDFSKRQ